MPLVDVGNRFPQLCNEFDDLIEEICELHECVFKRVYDFSMMTNGNYRHRYGLTLEGKHQLLGPIAATYKRKIAAARSAVPAGLDIGTSADDLVSEHGGDDESEQIDIIETKRDADLDEHKSKRRRPGRQHNRRIRKVYGVAYDSLRHCDIFYGRPDM